MKTKHLAEHLSFIEVTNLFGRFNHRLEFTPGRNISIVTAPNGYGKTVLLRMVDSIFNGKLNLFLEISFGKLTIGLLSGRSISIRSTDDASQATTVMTNGFGDDDARYEITSNFQDSLHEYLETNFPVERIGEHRWIDHSRGRIATTAQIASHYSNRLPEHLLDSVWFPDWLKKAVASVDTHLVETQRLLYFEKPNRSQRFRKSVRHTPPSAVEKDASDLANRIGRLLQQYANESQKLDQTFPKRIFKFRSDPVIQEESIRDSLDRLTKKRDDLVSAGLLSGVENIGSIESDPIQSSDALQDESIRRILSIYIDDTRKKLDIFEQTYTKIRLFKQIINQNFLFKKIEIDPEGGIQAIDSETEKTIPLSGLSSGEQHELVMVYELLFKVRDGSVILVDEPELSLHVAWQKRFIADLQQIQKLKNIRAIIATHSPQIINDKWHIVQELKA